MSAPNKRKGLSIPTVLLVIGLLGLINATPAQETPSTSFYVGYGELLLSWSHTLPIPDALGHADVTNNVEQYQQGLAIATAVAETSALLGDVGAVRTAVGAESIAAGAKALADSEGIAQSFFLLQNNTGRNLKVSFDWSAEWHIEGAIDDPSTDRTETDLYLTLQKHEVRFNNVRAIVDRIQRSIRDRRDRNDVFAQQVTARLPPELNFFEGGSAGDSFVVNFGPRRTYLFVLSAEIKGLSTVAVGGCPPSFWRSYRPWPVDPRANFADVFGAGPPRLRLDRAVWRRQSLEDQFLGNAVAALLNAASPEVAYYTDDPSVVTAVVREALMSGEYEAANTELAYYNNMGVPQFCD